MKTVAVVIPIYRTDLSDSEWVSLKRTLTVLSGHSFVIACPASLDLGVLSHTLKTVNYVVKRFDDGYFKGLSGYNQLMLSKTFYKALEDYEYILICQLDVFVFEDRLEYWCGKGYDYVGAPWLASKQTSFNRLLFKINNVFRRKTKSSEHYFKVGNGGFSLRKTAAMLRSVSYRDENLVYTQSSLSHWSPQNFHIEDLYFSLVAPTLTDMHIPEYREAASFCADRKPALALKLNRGVLPFACHRFHDPKSRRFWRPIIAECVGVNDAAI